MTLGQKYIYKRKGNEYTATWIESILDMERYLSKNVFCPITGFPLYKEERIGLLWFMLDQDLQRKVNLVRCQNGQDPF